jgi:hypothetical protein
VLSLHFTFSIHFLRRGIHSRIVSLLNYLFSTHTKKLLVFIFADDAMGLRVFFMAVAAVHDTGNITLCLQPSIPGHSVLTDFLFLATDSATDWPLTFMEVKRFSDSMHVDIHSESAAQTFREAYILLCESEWASRGLSEMGFVLSNSVLWSFTRTQGYGNWIANTSRLTIYGPESPERVVFYLRTLLCGQWPLAENPAGTPLPLEYYK